MTEPQNMTTEEYLESFNIKKFNPNKHTVYDNRLDEIENVFQVLLDPNRPETLSKK